MNSDIHTAYLTAHCIPKKRWLLITGSEETLIRVCRQVKAQWQFKDVVFTLSTYSFSDHHVCGRSAAEMETQRLPLFLVTTLRLFICNLSPHRACPTLACLWLQCIFLHTEGLGSWRNLANSNFPHRSSDRQHWTHKQTASASSVIWVLPSLGPH